MVFSKQLPAIITQYATRMVVFRNACRDLEGKFCYNIPLRL